MTDGRRKWMSLGWVGVALVCCGGPTFVVQQYSGPQRPRESIAVIRVNGGGPRLATLDDEQLIVPERGTRFHIEVLPGVHEIEVDEPTLGRGSRVRFVAEADKVYRIVVRPSITGSVVAQPYEVDRSSDAELRPALAGTDAPPPLPAAPPAPAPSAPDAGPQDAASEGG